MDLQAILVPVLWDSKERHENALHIFLPESMTTWISLNLDVEIHGFKFWMAHELGHCLAPELVGNEGEDFADAFAGALLFPQQLAEQAYKDVSRRKGRGRQVNAIKDIAEQHLISPVSVYFELNKAARQIPGATSCWRGARFMACCSVGSRIRHVHETEITAAKSLGHG